MKAEDELVKVGLEMTLPQSIIARRRLAASSQVLLEEPRLTCVHNGGAERPLEGVAIRETA